MASPEIDGYFNIQIEGEDLGHALDFHEDRKSSPAYNARNIPEPPPPPSKICSKSFTHRGRGKSDCVPKETRDSWDKLFKDGYGADVHIITDDGSFIPAHYTLLRVSSSPLLVNLLQQSKVKNGIRCIRIPGVPHDAVFIFIRFLYSACYEEREMKKFVLHLLVLSHSYSVPSLKRVCMRLLEQSWLSPENVIDVLQLGRNCDAPRLILVCLRMITRNFKNISPSEGWKVMRRANPELEQELLEYVVEANSVCL